MDDVNKIISKDKLKIFKKKDNNYSITCNSKVNERCPLNC